jgi:putative ABC transport system substrate-binding protein
LWRIGVLWLPPASRLEPFRHGLRELGYIEGQNIVLEVRLAEGRLERLPALAAELARLEVDVIMTTSPPAVSAAIHATRTIPIVMAAVGDAVDYGFVASLAKPGGNVTGSSWLNTELSAKRVDLLKDALPHVSRVAVLWEPSVGNTHLRATEATAGSLAMRIQVLKVSNPGDFQQAFLDAKKAGSEAMIVLASPILASHTKVLAALAAQHRLPAIFDRREYVEAGGLLGYGPSFPALLRRAATFVDKILKGAKPADIPVEQPTKFELVVNLKTARTLGLTLPRSILLRADQVIE